MKTKVRGLLLSAAVALLLAADEPKGDPGESDQDRLQGTWEVVSYKCNGQVTKYPIKLRNHSKENPLVGETVEEDSNEHFFLHIEDDRFEYLRRVVLKPSQLKGIGVDALRQKVGAPYKPIVYTFKIDPTKDPKWIDEIVPAGVRRGIYRLDGDSLMICTSSPSPPGDVRRPTEFDSKPDSFRNDWKLRKLKK